MLIIQQHCFSYYRLPIFQEILSGKAGAKGRLVFGLNPPGGSLKTYTSVDDIPENDQIQRNQYQILKNRWICGLILWQSGLLREVLRRDVKYVIFEGDAHHLSTWFCAFFARLFGKRVGFWTHGARSQKRGLKACVFKIFYRLPHFFLLYGDRGKKHLETLGVSSEKLYPIRNSLDYPKQAAIRDSVTEEELQKYRSRFFKYPDLPVLLWVGRISSLRRLDLTILAAAKLHQEGKQVNLLFVGPGDEQGDLKQLAIDSGLGDYVHFHGPSYHEEELARLFMLSTVVVSPGPTGLTCTHAITYGVPVITSDDWDQQKPEIDAIIPNKTGLFFKKDDVDDLVEKIQQIINMKKQPAYSYDTIEKYFSVEYQCKVIEAAINNQPPTGWEEFRKHTSQCEVS